MHLYTTAMASQQCEGCERSMSCVYTIASLYRVCDVMPNIVSAGPQCDDGKYDAKGTSSDGI